MAHFENTNRSFIVTPFSLISPEIIKNPLNYKYQPWWDFICRPTDIRAWNPHHFSITEAQKVRFVATAISGSAKPMALVQWVGLYEVVGVKDRWQRAVLLLPPLLQRAPDCK